MHYNLLDYAPTEHFKERAKERYGIGESQIEQFLKENTPANDTNTSTQPGRITVMSSIGNIFALDINNNTIVTVFKGMTSEIAKGYQHWFDTELSRLIQTAELLTAKSYANEIQDNTIRLNSNIEKLQHASVADLSPSILDEIQEDMAVVKTTFNLLSRQNNYYHRHKHLDTVDMTNSKHTNHKPISNETTTNEMTQNTKENIKPPSGVTNGALLTDKLILKEILEAEDKVAINNWLTRNAKSQVASYTANMIKGSCTKTELEAGLKSQMAVVTHNNFKKFLKSVLATRIK